MRRRSFLGAALALGGGSFCGRSTAAVEPGGPSDGFDLPVAGRVKTRSAKEIAASSWSVGGEGLDRDFAVYDHYKDYLGPLGAKGIRLQAGWAKCEKEPGVYSWGWLDAIVDDALSRGVQPWLQISYGNPIYPGGGEAGLRGGLPSSAEALAAWERWARALVDRYRDRVREWEVWNEPDLDETGKAPVEGYVDLYVRTATIVRELHPEGRLLALALCCRPAYAERFLELMSGRERLDLIDAITVHTYPRNPDDVGIVNRVREAAAKAGRESEIRQGETGAPSRLQENFALAGIAWTETTQAKWNLRRMLAHHAKGVPFNLFTMSDLHYRSADGEVQMNYKGLLATNPDRTIAYAKPAYAAAQHVFAIFDDTLKPIDPYPFTTTSLRRLSVGGFRRDDGAQVAAYWFDDAPPAEGNDATSIDVTFADGRFDDPVVVDLRTGAVYDLPEGSWARGENGTTFRGLPAYDSPVLVAGGELWASFPQGRRSDAGQIRRARCGRRRQVGPRSA